MYMPKYIRDWQTECQTENISNVKMIKIEKFFTQSKFHNHFLMV